MKKSLTKSELIKKCQNIKLILTDVDGVLTDGGMYFSENGELLKKFNTRDGMGVELLLEKNVKTILITRENSKITKQRGKKIHAAVTYVGIKNKEEHFEKICKKFGLKKNEIAYIGDDVNDIAIMNLVGLSASPHDAMPEIKSVVDYACNLSGGHGAFREFANLIISAKLTKR